MKRVTLVLLLFGLCSTHPSFGQDHKGHAGSPRRVVRRHAHGGRPGVTPSPIQAMLLRRVNHVDWDDVPFGDVLEWLRNQSAKANKVNVIPRWRALAGVGVDKQTLVTLEMEEVTVAQALGEVLDQLSGSDPLSYVGEGNTLRISIRSDFRRKLVTRSYDVADILMQMRATRVKPQFFSGHQLDLGAATATPGAGIGGSGRTFNIGATLFGDPANDDDDQDEVPDEELDQKIINTIQNTVAPQSWAINGGRGTLTIMGGVLIVHNSVDVHQLLGGPFHRDK